MQVKEEMQDGGKFKPCLRGFVSSQQSIREGGVCGEVGVKAID